MKRITFFLLLLPSIVFGQIDLKKKAFFYAQAQAVASPNITSVTYAIDTIYYTNESIDLSATPNVTTLYSKWEITNEDGDLVGLDFGNTVSIHSITDPGTGIATFSNTTDPNGVVVRVSSKTGYKIYFLFSNANDKVVVSRWY